MKVPWSWAQVQRAATLAHVAAARVVEIRRRRTYAGEEEWFALLDMLTHGQLRRGFIASGVTPAVAGNLVFFIEEQRALDRHFSRNQAVKYRRILAELDPLEVARAARTIPGQFNQQRAA